MGNKDQTMTDPEDYATLYAPKQLVLGWTIRHSVIDADTFDTVAEAIEQLHHESCTGESAQYGIEYWNDEGREWIAYRSDEFDRLRKLLPKDPYDRSGWIDTRPVVRIALPAEVLNQTQDSITSVDIRAAQQTAEQWKSALGSRAKIKERTL